MVFKDPFQPDQTPYEILGLDPGASPAEVQASLARFMRDRKNLPRLAIAQQAIRKLKTPSDRAQVDLWLYNVEIEPIEPSPEVDIRPMLAGLWKVPCYSADDLYSDAAGLDPSQEKSEIEFQEMPIDDIPEFER
jgi:hypothetical protein